MPGLDPASVEGVRGRPESPYEVAYVQDGQDRRWVIKAPLTQAAGAMLEDVTALLQLLGRRLDVAIPMVRGQVTVPEGRALVYPRLPGRALDFARLPPGPLAAEVGRVLAHVHNVEHLLFEEAGRPTYDAEAHRRRQLSELDRAAATGHVPTNLLTRWEHLLEDVALWRFAPCPVHGTFTGENVLASFENEQDAGSGRVRGVLAWEESRIGDPADDLAELVAVGSPATVDSVLEAYAQSRVERPDANLVVRARLAGEMRSMRTLLRGLGAGQLGVVERSADELRGLDERTDSDDRRNAQLDAERLERNRRERAAAFAAAEVQAVRPRAGSPSVGSGATEATEATEAEAAAEATAPHAPFPRAPEQADDAAEMPDDDTASPDQAGRADRPVGSPFEIDEAEPLPTDENAVLDLHEGASDFVPLDPPKGGHRPGRA